MAWMERSSKKLWSYKTLAVPNPISSPKQVWKRLGRQAKLFNVRQSPSQSEKSNHIKVGRQKFPTNHLLVESYTHDFSSDRIGLGVLSSIAISSKEAGLGVKVVGTYWAPANNLESSPGQLLFSYPMCPRHSLKQRRAALTSEEVLSSQFSGI